MGILFDRAQKNKKKKHQYVDYWLDDTSLNLEDRGEEISDIIKLVSIKRAISNFIRIVTNRAIPVIYSSGKESYTNGKQVVISASTKEKNFDAVVGLALHEGSHCLLSNFEFFENLHFKLPKIIPSRIVKLANSKGIDNSLIRQTIMQLINVLEDRRIDYFMYRTARGYRPYYEAMYDHYFRNKQIDYALQKKVYAVPTLQTYMFYIINITNPWFDTRDLPDLDLIYGLIDLKNINRFDRDDFSYWNSVKSSDPELWDFEKMPEILRTAVKIFEIILNNIGKVPNINPIELPSMSISGDSKQGGDGDDLNKEANMDSGGFSGADEQSDEDSSEGSSDDKDSKGGDSDSDDDGKRVEKKAEDLPKRTGKINEKRLRKAIDKQKDFIDGTVKKKKLTKKAKEQVNAMEQSGANMVAIDYVSTYGGRRKADVVILRKLTMNIIRSGVYPFSTAYKGNLYENPSAKKAVQQGFKKGKILAHRLAIRNQNQITVYNRQDRGHLDKKRIFALGYNEESVFFKKKVVKFKPVLTHLTLDASSSMYGDKFGQALEVGVALAVAAHEITNLDVVISIRAGIRDKAYISIIYDSRNDDPSKIKKLFPYLVTRGGTPEGLCYEAIMNLLLETKADRKYFINVSDGMPAFEGYGGEPAHAHTREQINRLRAEGFSILSYFIDSSHYGWGGARNAFKVMYGKDASFIDTQNVGQLVTTLNRLYLER